MGEFLDLNRWCDTAEAAVCIIHCNVSYLHIDLCRDGVTRSGLLCSLSYLLERLKAEQDVDVFHSVKHARVNRPQLVPTFVSC